MQYKTIIVTSFEQNCSLIWCKKTKHASLIDPGGDHIKLQTIINESKLIIKNILITHGHLDHVGAALELSKYYSIPIIGPHQNDAILLMNLPYQSYIFSYKYTPPLIPDYWLKENDKIKIGYQYLQTLHCPGHSPGHVAFWNKKQDIIFIGDILFKNNIGRTDLPGGNKKQLLYSIKKNILQMKNTTILLPGHGPSSTIEYEKVNNSFLFNL